MTAMIPHIFGGVVFVSTVTAYLQAERKFRGGVVARDRPSRFTVDAKER